MKQSRTLRLACALALALLTAALGGCGKDDGVSLEQLAARACEIGPQFLGEAEGLSLAQETAWAVEPREGDVDFFGQGDPPWWVQADGRVSLSFDEPTTTKELAERMATVLRANGWAPRDPWPGRPEFPFSKTDDLGTWSMIVTYGTKSPPQAQWVTIELTSPHTNKDPVDPGAKFGYLEDDYGCNL